MSKSLYFTTPLAFKSPTEGFPWDDLRKIFNECQWMAKVPDGEEKLPKILTGRLSRVHQLYRQTTDRRNGDSI